MDNKKFLDKTTVVLLLYAIILSIYAFVKREDYEFLYALVSTIALIILLHWYDKKHKATKRLIILIGVLAFVHGTSITINFDSTRLIDVVLFGLIRMDHLLSIFTAVILSLSIHPVLKEKFQDRGNKLWRYAIQILMVMGFIALWEVVGLFGVLFLNQAENVGGYLNNALDLLSAFIGAIIMSAILIKNEARNSL